MKILPNFEEETIESILKKDFPELDINKVALINKGVDNVAADVDGKYIFRFPRDAGVRQDEEIKVLKNLEGKITLPIPKLEFFGKEYSYTGYKKLIGDPLTEETYAALSDQEKDSLANELANFFKEIHSAMTVEEAKEIGVDQELSKWYLDNVKENRGKFVSDPKILAFVDANIAKFTEVLKSDKNLFFIYHDLHEDNIAYDSAAKRLNGIFDFGDVQIGNYNLEFAPIYRFANSDLVKRIVGQYEKLTGRKVDWEIVKTYAYIWKISDIAEYGKPIGDIESELNG